ncbi:hypothetical protein ACFOWX_01270 [Sphingorhabdus arenilitoris]|uniref:SRPBCC family protein n=1 Tax=Sphingorhabdus arenilitoris TaxID=1490041 RepID=A0ABV8RCU8_9SPHN
MRKLFISALVTLTALPTAAMAEVKDSSENGFVIIHNAEVDATPDEIWKRLISPKDWWNKAHSWSGSSAGFYIDAQANGCFCELFQEKGADGKMKTVGSVEHMRVIFAQPGNVLRMQGALGPLQSEAVTGTLTVAMAANKGKAGTKLSFSYVVGGYMRYKVGEIAPAVDKVLGEQMAGLVKPFKSLAAVENKPSNWSLDLDGLGIGEGKNSDQDDSDAEGKGTDAAIRDKAKAAVDKKPPATVKKPQPATSGVTKER